MSEPIIVYTSTYCMHSRSVERLLKKHDIVAEFINIDGDREARQAVMALNDGYASVPTLLFPDGTQLTEPSSKVLLAKLGLESPSLADRLKGAFGQD
ncbi:MAG: glutaredoxin family protein [Candidatus Promineifilaceae bacterium]|jgi:mycoredoxin